MPDISGTTDLKVYDSPQLEVLKTLDSDKLRLINDFAASIAHSEAIIMQMKKSLRELSLIFLDGNE